MKKPLWIIAICTAIRCADCIHLKETSGHANCNGYMTCRLTGKSVDLDGSCAKGEE